MHLAEDTELGRRVALEVLPSDMTADDVARKRLDFFEGGHLPPVELTLRTIGPWLDEMLGPVRRE